MPADPASVAARLEGAAASAFVGRRAELDTFDRLLAPALPDAVLLWFHGPGGIGKSTLLRQLRERAAQNGRRTLWLDGALIDPRPDAFVAALELDDPRGAAEPGVLFIDTAEDLAPLHRWLRDTFLPALPATWLVVAAGRQPPAPTWCSDAAWATLMQCVPLAALDTADSRALLAARGMPEDLQPAALDFANGHPLALALLAELTRRANDRPAEAVPPPGGDVVQTLVQCFTRDATTAAQADALQVCAFARHTTEALLAATLDDADARALFSWLRSLSFVQAGPHGLAPHALVRDVLVGDALWRDAERCDRLRRAIYRHCYERIAHTSGRERLHHQAEAIYTQRHQPHKRRFFDWDALGQHRVDAAREDDLSRLEAMVCRHEGESALRWLNHWWLRQREGFRLFWRDDDHGAACDGFLLMLRLGHDTPAQDLADPAVAAAWAFVQSQRALQPGDELVLLRHWMHAEQHQAVSAAINLSSMHVVSHLITHPESAWSVVWMADPDFWQPHFDGVNFARCPAADHTEGGRRHGAFVHDWRVEPADRWTAGEHRPMPFASPVSSAGAAPPAAVSVARVAATGSRTSPTDAGLDAAFVDAVRDALRTACDKDTLGRGALADALGLDGPALHERLRDGVRALAAHPRDAKFRDALWLTYIEPRHKQEQVAAELGIPFPTYRYRLQQGVERLAKHLSASAAADPD